MRAVPVLQALSWGGESPLLPSGEVDIEALAHGLAGSDYPGGRRRQPYTRAQHALVVSEAVETLAGLRLPARRVLAMHAWLADVRDAELRDEETRGRGQEAVGAANDRPGGAGGRAGAHEPVGCQRGARGGGIR